MNNMGYISNFATRRISPGYIALDCERVKEIELRAEKEMQPDWTEIRKYP